MAARVLVVDDEPGVRYFVEETLLSSDYHVMSVSNGAAALELLPSQKFDVAILDLKMPGVGGLDVLRALRSESPCTVSIVLTGYGSLETALVALRQGAYDYLLKPCSPQQLRDCVRSGLDKHWHTIQRCAEAKFITNLTYQFRHPLTSLELNLQLLERSSGKKRLYYLSHLKQATQQMKQLLEGTATLSHLQFSNKPLKFVEMDLNFLVAQVVNAYQHMAQSHDLELLFEPVDCPLPIRAVQSQIIQAITNLVQNAIKYTHTGHIDITTSINHTHQRACLEVKDTGVGISEDELPYLFERFYHDTWATSNGSGLGLAIVKEIITLHQGTIEVESQLNQGSLFRVCLPVVAS